MTYRTTTSRLLEVYRYFKENPDGKINTGMWTQPTWTATEFFRWFRKCLLAKIEAHDDRPIPGGATTEEYDRELYRFGRMYIGNRVIINWIPPILGADVKKVFEHRLRTAEEF